MIVFLGCYNGHCGTELNQGVGAVGYGTTQYGIDYWFHVDLNVIWLAPLLGPGVLQHMSHERQIKYLFSNCCHVTKIMEQGLYQE